MTKREIYRLEEDGHIYLKVKECPDQYNEKKDTYFTCTTAMCLECDASRGFFNEDNQQVMWHTDLCGNLMKMGCVRPEPVRGEQ